MPLANNSTGAGAGDNYNSSNPAMVTGILSPADGDVYVYGYDNNRQQVIIRKVAKSAQVPHKGMNAHPVYTNNLLSTYIKNAVIPRTVGATHTPQAVVPRTVGATHTPQAVVPTVNDFLSAYQKTGVVPTVTDFLSTYVKNAVTPVAGTQQPRFSWGDPNRFKQVLQNMSGDLRRGALHGKAGANTRESFEQEKPSGQTVTYTNLLPLTMLRLNALKDNPVSGSTTHALHGLAGTQQPKITWANPERFRQQLRNISGTPESGALHGVTSNMLASYVWSEEQKNNFRQQLRNMSVTPPSGALHGKAGAFSSVTPQGKNRTNHTQQWLDLRRQSGFKSMGALHGKAGTNTRGSATTKNSQGQTISFTNLLSPTVRRLDALSQNPILGSHTHALHGRAGSGGTLVQGKFTTYKTQAKDVMAKGGALHGRAGLGGAGNSAFGAVMGALQSVLGAGGSNWPIARFHFYVMIGGTELGFQGVEGLEASVGVIEYRDGNSPFFGKEKMPGLVTYEKVTMKKGMFTNDTSANGWFKEIAQDRQYTKRRTIIIALMDNNMVPQFVWRYEQCFLTKVVPTNLDAESENEVAIEELEFVGRAWYLETLAGMAGNAVGALAGAAGINLSF